VKILLGKTQAPDIFGGDVNLEFLLQKLDDFSAHHRVHPQLGQRRMLTHGLDVFDAAKTLATASTALSAP
jgi:hypothetical protein